VWMAQLAEKGKITSIFFADTYGTHETYGGSSDTSFSGGTGVASLDPVVMVSAMAYATKHISFAITGNTTYLSEL
jgi:alkanesulfonate monooxygenase SsuD/methylene tetrahydromethanopterin reductase-like flavin-dependent oxidoreductase (luciferase family)